MRQVVARVEPSFGGGAHFGASTRCGFHICGVAPQGGGLAQCIRTNFLALTEPCKTALVKIAAVTEVCGKDIQQQCPGINPGAGRLFLCVKAHYAALSEPCKDAMGHAAERSLHAQ